MNIAAMDTATFVYAILVAIAMVFSCHSCAIWLP